MPKAQRYRSADRSIQRVQADFDCNRFSILIHFHAGRFAGTVIRGNQMMPLPRWNWRHPRYLDGPARFAAAAVPDGIQSQKRYSAPQHQIETSMRRPLLQLRKYTPLDFVRAVDP